ncbi:MAG TPA: biotin/lipoate A/B protein ligase family protein [Burkholderiales bacterium]|nr:biotin/lipoate A/B protein ligase family protein [Burkholderiales bacterium]
MAETWRLIDTGLRPAAQNIALDRALLEARRAGEIPSTLRFLRFAPCALIGCGQSPGQELNLEACRAGGFDIQRRLTGGDVMVLDERQLVWALYLDRHDTGTTDLRTISRRLCHAAAAAVSALGVNAAYRAQNEIEVDGRRISESAGVFDGDALLFQGTLFVDLDPGTLARVSRLLGAAPGAASNRVANLKELLGAKPDISLIRRNLMEAFECEFGVEFGECDLTLSENTRYQAALQEIGPPDWINLVSRPAAELPLLRAQHQTAGGRLHAAIAYDRPTRVIRQTWFATEVSLAPPRVLADLEAALRHVPADRLEQRIERFFAGRAVDMTPLSPADFIGAVQLALGQLLVDRV